MTEPKRTIKLKTEKANLYYGERHALKNITMDIPACAITAIIGPSGCGKSSLLRIFNRMNDLIPGARMEGDVFLDNMPIYCSGMDAVSLRQRVGMVFQKPNPFPMSIIDNITIGPRRHGIKRKDELEAIAERCLKQVALWDEVKDGLKKPSLTLPLGDFFHRSEVPLIWFFIGCVLGTLPSLYGQAGKQGRKGKHLIICGLTIVAGCVLLYSMQGWLSNVVIPTNSVLTWLLAGALVGLGALTA